MRLAVKELRRLIEDASQRQEFEDVFDEVFLAVNELEGVDVSEPLGQTTKNWRGVEIWLPETMTVKDLADINRKVYERCKAILTTMTGEKPMCHFERVVTSGQEQATASHLSNMPTVMMVVRARQERHGLMSVKVQVHRPLRGITKEGLYEASRKKTDREKKEEVELLSIELFDHLAQTYGKDSVLNANTKMAHMTLQAIVPASEILDNDYFDFTNFDAFGQNIAGLVHAVTGEAVKTESQAPRFYCDTSSLTVTIEPNQQRGFTRSSNPLPRKTEPDEVIVYFTIRSR